MKQEKCKMGNQTWEAIFNLKNISRKSPTVNLSFVSDNVKHVFAKNKMDDNFKIGEKTENRNINQCTDVGVQILFNDESKDIIDGRHTTPQLTHCKEL